MDREGTTLSIDYRIDALNTGPLIMIIGRKEQGLQKNEYDILREGIM